MACGLPSARVVEVGHRDAADADGLQLLDQHLGLAAGGGAHEVGRALRLVARRVGHRVAADERRAAVLQHLRRGRRGARAHAGEEGQGFVITQKLLVVGDGLVGLELVVERDHPDLAAVDAALGVGGLEGEVGARQHGLDRRPQGAPEDGAVAEHDLGRALGQGGNAQARQAGGGQEVSAVHVVSCGSGRWPENSCFL